MAIKKSAKATEEKKVYEFDIEVTRALELDNGTIMFDMNANHVIIKGCAYKVLTNHTTGEEFGKISFPSEKGKDDKWYNRVYFQISPATMEKIEKGIEALLDKVEKSE